MILVFINPVFDRRPVFVVQSLLQLPALLGTIATERGQFATSAAKYNRFKLDDAAKDFKGGKFREIAEKLFNCVHNANYFGLSGACVPGQEHTHKARGLSRSGSSNTFARTGAV